MGNNVSSDSLDCASPYASGPCRACEEELDTIDRWRGVVYASLAVSVLFWATYSCLIKHSEHWPTLAFLCKLLGLVKASIGVYLLANVPSSAGCAPYDVSVDTASFTYYPVLVFVLALSWLVRGCRVGDLLRAQRDKRQTGGHALAGGQQQQAAAAALLLPGPGPGAEAGAAPMALPVHHVKGQQEGLAPPPPPYAAPLAGGRCEIVISSRPMGIVLKSLGGGGAVLGIASVRFPELVAGSRLVAVQALAGPKALDVSRLPYARIIHHLTTAALPFTMAFDA